MVPIEGDDVVGPLDPEAFVWKLGHGGGVVGKRVALFRLGAWRFRVYFAGIAPVAIP